MESNGQPGRVHMSEATANLIRQDPDKQDWVTARPDLVHAKGKGSMQCYWLDIPPEEDHSENPGLTPAVPSIWIGLSDVLTKSTQRSNGIQTTVVEILSQGLKRIQAHRDIDDDSHRQMLWEEQELSYTPEGSALDEARYIEELLAAPTGTAKPVQQWNSRVDSIQLDGEVLGELAEFVEALCGLFINKNPYHCLDHACYQLVSMNRILEERILNCTDEHNDVYAQLANDPLAQWALLLASFVSGVDNPGVSNAYLVEAEPEMAEHFNNHCLIEQNAIDTMWDVLFESSDTNHLVRAFCPKGLEDLKRFRLLFVHAVLSSNIDLEEDIFAADQDNRWARLVETCQATPPDLKNNNLATLVMLEQLMQTSSMVQSVQPWEFFLKWTERAFRESYLAYIVGKEFQDPCRCWYDKVRQSLEGCTIPLARRLHTRAVYGDDYEDFANMALRNLRKWESNGPSILVEMIASAKYAFGEKKE